MSANQVATPLAEKPTTYGPYKFLDYFVEADSQTFMGRSRDIEEVTARLSVDRSVVLYGRSGLGKTSLVLAGVFPIFRKRGFDPIHCRVLEDPVADVTREIESALHIDLALFLPGLSLEPAETYAGRPILLVLDQFEELFIRFAREPEKRRAFIVFLYSIFTSNALDVRIMLSLREDYISRLDEFSDISEDWFRSSYRLPPLTAYGARQAITRPLMDSDIRYEAQVVNRIIDIIAPEEFDSVLLQIVCTAVVGHAIECGSPEYVRESDLDEVGGLDGILKRFLERATQLIPHEYLLLTRTVLDAMVTSESTKRAVTVNHLMEWDFASSDTELRFVLRLLARQRLVREEDRMGQMWYELAHERLVPSILQWFQLDKTFTDYRFARELIANNSRDGRFRSLFGLLINRDGMRETVRPFRERIKLNILQKQFLFFSCVYYRSEDDLEYWATQLESEQYIGAVKELLASNGTQARIGALWTAARLKIAELPIPDACLEMAMTDSDPDVCEAASAAFPLIAGPVQIAKLQSHLSNRKTQKRALRVLSEFDRRDRAVATISWFLRRRAHSLAERRAVDRHLVTVSDRTKSGTFVCIAAASIWVALVGLPLLVGISYCIGETFSTNLVAILLFIVPDVLGCYLTLRAAARASILRKRFFVPMGSIVATSLIYSSVIVFLSRGHFGRVEGFSGVALAIGCSFMVVTAIMLTVALVSSRWLKRPHTTTAGLWADSFLLSFAPTLFLGFTSSWFLAARHEYVSRAILLIALGVCPVIFAGILSCQYASGWTPQSGHFKLAWPSPNRHLLRTACLLCFAGLVFMFQHVFGWHSIPLFPKTVEVDSHLERIGPLPANIDARSGWSRAYYIRMHASRPTYYKVITHMRTFGNSEAPATVFVPAGTRPPVIDILPLSVQGDLQGEVVPELDPGSLDLSQDQWQYRVVTFTPVPSANKARAEFQYHLSLQTGPDEEDWVAIACLPFRLSVTDLRYGGLFSSADAPNMKMFSLYTASPKRKMDGLSSVPSDPLQAFVTAENLDSRMQALRANARFQGYEFMEGGGKPSISIVKPGNGRVEEDLFLIRLKEGEGLPFNNVKQYPSPPSIQMVVALRLVPKNAMTISSDPFSLRNLKGKRYEYDVVEGSPEGSR